jgi:hypothetical protein
MLQHALKAKIPIISIQTDDLINLDRVLQSIASPMMIGGEWKNVEAKSSVMVNGRLYWTTDESEATIHNYMRLQKNNCCLVVVNPAKPTHLMFDGGPLITPPALIEEYLKPFTKAEQRQQLIQALKGLSLKTASEVIALTIARVGGAIPNEVRRTRTMISGTVQGLIPMESELDEFYQWPPQLEEWVKINKKYFEDSDAPHKLIPRGLLLAGSAGVGKSSAARAVAHRFKVPFYRLDITQALNKWQGESENRVIRALALAEAEAPCVILIDEVEKIFTHADEAGVVTRILSTMLWWLSEHTSRVITIMTTNKKEKIPPELYRPGRLDKVLVLPKLSLKDAKQFTIEVYKDVIGKAPAMAVQNKLREAIDNANKSEFAHSEVCDIVYSQIKQYDWFEITGKCS